MLRRSFLLLATGGIATLAGCETVENTGRAGDLAAVQQRADRSLVGGQFRWIEIGVERDIEQSLFGWSIAPRIKRHQDRRIMKVGINAGGHFLWSLPSGASMIDRINYCDPMTGNYFIAPLFAFAVPKNGRNYYVGTMRIDSVTNRDFFWTLDGTVRYSVEDNFDKEPAYIRAKIGTDLANVEKSLRIHHPRLPATIDTTAEAQIALTLFGGIL